MSEMQGNVEQGSPLPELLVIRSSTLTSIADVIRAKTGINALIPVSSLANEVQELVSPLAIQLKLHAPFLSLSDSILTITSNINNGDFVTSYDIYDNGEVVGSYPVSGMGLFHLNLVEGSHSLAVKAKAEIFKDSEFSNAVIYSAFPSFPEGALVTSDGHFLQDSEGTRLTVPSTVELTVQLKTAGEVGVEYDGTASITGGNTVTFVANGATWAVFGVLPGQAVYPPAGPTKEGLYFNGWYTEEDGSGDKIAFPYVPDANITLYANFADTTVIGVTGLTNEDGTLTLTDDIAGMDGYYKVQNGNYVRATSKLNGIFPFSDIKEFTDDSGNVFVKFPKLWMKWETDDADRITGYKFSNYQADKDFFIPDAFLDPTNTAADTYLDYFALGKYEMSGSTDKGYSVSGASLLTNITRGEGREAARAYGSVDNLYNGYQMLDFAQLTLYNLMCMMFFGTANIQKVYGGRTGLGTVAEWGDNSITGTTDGVDGLNGWNLGTDCVKMLGVENPYGNASKWVDGIYFSGATIYAHRFPQQYADSTENAISLGFYRPYASGYITALKKGTTDETRSFVYASEVGGSGNQYYGDSAYCHTDGIYGDALFSGGSYGGNEGAGLWYFSGNSIATEAYNFRGARLAYRPVDTKEG